MVCSEYMRLAKLLIAGLLSLLACGCTTRVELANPVIAIYKHYRDGGTSGLDSAIQLYRTGRIKFTHRQARTGIMIDENVRIPPDSLRMLRAFADSVHFFERSSDFRYEPFVQSRYTLDLEDLRSLPADYWIYLYRNEYSQHTVAIYHDSPADLKAFGERLKSVANKARLNTR
jgi:hypothetical protein